MKTVSITQARRQLGELVRTPETVEVTSRGVPVGTLHIHAEPTYDRDKALEAARGLRQLGAKILARRKPSKKNGAVKAIRDLRDDGR